MVSGPRKFDFVSLIYILSSKIRKLSTAIKILGVQKYCVSLLIFIVFYVMGPNILFFQSHIFMSFQIKTLNTLLGIILQVSCNLYFPFILPHISW